MIMRSAPIFKAFALTASQSSSCPCPRCQCVSIGERGRYEQKLASRSCFNPATKSMGQDVGEVA